MSWPPASTNGCPIYRTMEVAEPSNLPPLIALQEWLLQAVTADLMFWLLADEQTLDNSSDQKELGAGVETVEISNLD